MKRDQEFLFGMMLAVSMASCVNPAGVHEPTAANPPEAGAAIGILWWPADPSMDGYSFASRIEKCLTKAVGREFPDATIVPQQQVRDMLYPLMEPGTQPASEAEFAALLRRDDVHSRLLAEHVRYLVAFSGSTEVGEWEGGIICGAGYGGGGCLGFSWSSKSTHLDAALWDLQTDGSLKDIDAEERGTSIMPALGLPVPLLAATESSACQELAMKIVTAVAGQS